MTSIFSLGVHSQSSQSSPTPVSPRSEREQKVESTARSILDGKHSEVSTSRRTQSPVVQSPPNEDAEIPEMEQLFVGIDNGELFIQGDPGRLPVSHPPEEKKQGPASPASSGSIELQVPVFPVESEANLNPSDQAAARLQTIVARGLGAIHQPLPPPVAAGIGSTVTKKLASMKETVTSLIKSATAPKPKAEFSTDQFIPFLDGVKRSFGADYERHIQTIQETFSCLDDFYSALKGQRACCEIHEPKIFEQIKKLDKILKEYQTSGGAIVTCLIRENSKVRREKFETIFDTINKLVLKLRGFPADSAHVIRAKISRSYDSVRNLAWGSVDKMTNYSPLNKLKKSSRFQKVVPYLKAAAVGAAVAYTLPAVVGTADSALGFANSRIVSGLGTLATTPLRVPGWIGSTAEHTLGYLGTAFRWLPSGTAALAEVFPEQTKKIWNSKMVDQALLHGYKAGNQAIKYGFKAVKEPRKTVGELRKAMDLYFNPKPPTTEQRKEVREAAKKNAEKLKAEQAAKKKK